MRQPKRKPKLSKILLGIDEVGRGPWAGPLVIGAVVLQDNQAPWTSELTDSKRLSPKKRELLNAVILEKALATGLGWVPVTELDQHGLGAALKIAARRATEQILAQNISFDEIIIDGTINFLTQTPLEDKVTVLPKADLLVKEVSAASIIAKVARDHYMIKLAETYPEYGFDRHVGYGTTLHKQALLEHGICPEHRKSFRPIQELLSSQTVPTLNSQNDHIRSQSSTTTAIGQKAETLITEYLIQHGHTITARNFKTKTYEIDIISTKNQQIYFTEVKYRKNHRHGTPLAQITPTKQRQIRRAAELYLTHHPEFHQYQPLLAAGAVEGLDFRVTDWIIIGE